MQDERRAGGADRRRPRGQLITDTWLTEMAKPHVYVDAAFLQWEQLVQSYHQRRGNQEDLTQRQGKPALRYREPRTLDGEAVTVESRRAGRVRGRLLTLRAQWRREGALRGPALETAQEPPNILS